MTGYKTLLVICLSVTLFALVKGDDDDCEFNDDGHIDCSGLGTGWIIAIGVISLLVVVGIPILICFFCACLCFSGRRKNTPGQIHHPVVIPQQNEQHQQQPYYIPGNVNPAFQYQQQYPSQNYGVTTPQIPPPYYPAAPQAPPLDTNHKSV